MKKIKSQYIKKYIFEYTQPDKNIKLKLFNYSKEFQKYFDIKLIDYIEKYYLESIELNLDNYLHVKQEKYSKNYLKKKYNKFLFENKFNKEEFEKNIFDILENKKVENIKDTNEISKEKSDILIDIESPLFEILSKSKNFENHFSIYISQKNIDKYKLKNDYIKFFDTLNISKINYSSIYYSFGDKMKINYLNELNIDFNKIKKIYLIQEENEKSIKQKINMNENDKNEYFFGTLFSFKNIDNLIYLKIKFNSTEKLELNINENINNFKLLECLYIESINYDKNLTINLNHLKLLSLKKCKNIYIQN